MLLNYHVKSRKAWKGQRKVYRQMLAGNISGFADFAKIRQVDLASLEARQVPIFMSNNFEERCNLLFQIYIYII